MRVAVNLLWMVPGGVGGSEEYITRQLVALADRGLDELTLFVLPGFAAAHPDLASRSQVIVAPVSGRRRDVRVIVESTWLSWRLRRGTFDVTHFAGGTVPIGLANRPSVVTVHDIQYVVFPDTFSPLKLRYLRRAVPAAIRRASIIATPSTFVADTIQQAFNVDTERLVVVPNALTPSVSSPVSLDALRATYGIPGRFLIYPAITYRHKNHVMLLRAVAPLLAAEPTLRLVLLGGQGPCEERVRDEAVRLGITAQVVRPGRIPAADRDAMYDAATVMAFPSRYEGFGIPVLEAMARGCPVVAANATALPEAVGDAGLLVDPDDVNAWTEAIKRVMDEPSLSAELRARGYRRAAAFTVDRTANALREAYLKAGDHR